MLLRKFGKQHAISFWQLKRHVGLKMSSKNSEQNTKKIHFRIIITDKLKLRNSLITLIWKLWRRIFIKTKSILQF